MFIKRQQQKENKEQIENRKDKMKTTELREKDKKIYTSESSLVS